MRAKVWSRLGVVVALAAASLPALPAPARADDFAPEIVSFSRTGDGLVTGTLLVTIEFSARDEGPAGLEYALFTFGTPLGGEVRVDSPYLARAAAGTFTARKLLSPWAASGRYTLEKIEVYDRERNTRTYERDASPGLDFAGADFTVDNANEDTTVPTLDSARLFQSNVVQGTPVVVLYSASDDLSGVEKVVFTGWTPTGAQYWIESLPRLGAAGPATWLVPLAAPSGAYDAFGVVVEDRAGNGIMYMRDQETRPWPPQADVPEHDDPDHSSLAFQVRGGTGDRVSPEMTTFSPITPTTRHRGDVVALDYSAFDAGTGIAEAHAAWTDGRGHTLEARKTCGDRTHGPLSVRVEDFRTTGTDWELQYVALTDYLNNQTAYGRDGRVRYQGGDAGVPVHAFDLSRGDFRLEEGPPADEEIADTSALYCPRIGSVSLSLGDTDVSYGDVVTTAGTVSGAAAAVAEPIVAIHHLRRGNPRLVGVVQGDRGGRYAKSFVARENGKVAATFLGADGPSGAAMATSRRIAVRVRPVIDARLGSPRVAAGRPATIAGTVTPAWAGPVALQLRENGRWREVARQALDAGAFAFDRRTARRGSFDYRVVTPAGERLATGRSRVLTLRVTRP
ncbi:MAG: hypothetical protein ABR613_06780 [Actinomycetota bacterium]